MSAKNDKYQLFDVADYLVDLDDVAGYLELAIEDSGDDPSAVPRALGVIAHPIKQGYCAQFTHHRKSLVLAERRQSKDHVAQDLNVHAAESEHDNRAEHGVSKDSADGLNPAAQLWRHQEATHLGVGQALAHARQHSPGGLRCGLGRCEAHDNPPDLGLMGDVGREYL